MKSKKQVFIFDLTTVKCYNLNNCIIVHTAKEAEH